MGKLKYINVKNITATTADIYIYGEIVGDEWGKWCDTDVCPDDVIKALKETEGKELNIYINSPGGSVFAGLAIYNMLMRKPEKKTCYIDGVAASIASIICMAGDEIIMPSNSFLMIHKPSSGVWGNADDMRKTADDLDIIESGALEVYKSRLTSDEKLEELREMINAETWLTAESAAKYFGNIKVTGANKATAKLSADMFKNCRNTPDELLKPENKEDVDSESEALRMQLEIIG